MIARRNQELAGKAHMAVILLIVAQRGFAVWAHCAHNQQDVQGAGKDGEMHVRKKQTDSRTQDARAHACMLARGKRTPPAL